MKYLVHTRVEWSKPDGSSGGENSTTEFNDLEEALKFLGKQERPFRKDDTQGYSYFNRQINLSAQVWNTRQEIDLIEEATNGN